MTATLAGVFRLEDRLAAAGFHRRSPWWREQVSRFYSHPTATTLAVEVGRGGEKSGEIVRIAGAETLLGDFVVPPGERHFFVIVAENKDEAANRLRLLEAHLTALRVPYDRVGDEISLRDMPRGIKVLACRVGAVSGFRSFGWAADEVAKWSSDGVNPAAEIVASMRAMTVTHQRARKLIFSSPLGTLGFHYDTIQRGDDAHQLVGRAPTWIANPTISEAQTHALEPDLRVWRREYCAIAQAGAAGAFDSDVTDEAFRAQPPVYMRGQPVLVLDPSSGRKDRWTWGAVRWSTPRDGAPLLVFETIGGIGGRFYDQVSGDQIIDEAIMPVATEYGATDVHSDQREALMLQSAFQRRGLRFRSHDWTNANKIEAVARLRRLFQERRIILPECPPLRAELAAFEERITPSGALTFGARTGGHDDFVSLLVTAAIADAEGEISRGGPVQRAEVGGERTDYGMALGGDVRFSDDTRGF